MVKMPIKLVGKKKCYRCCELTTQNMKNIKKIQESAVHGNLLDISTITHAKYCLIQILSIAKYLSISHTPNSWYLIYVIIY